MSLFFIRNVLFSMVCTILLIVSRFIVIPIGETAYFTFQSIIIMLAGGILGARWGALSVFVWILLGVSGLPVLSEGVNGIEIFTGPMGGYIFGYLIAAFVIGCLTRMSKPSWVPLFLIYAIGGIGIINIANIGWFLFVYHVTVDLEVFMQSFVAFLPYDFMKVVLAVILTIFVYRVMPAFSPQNRRERR